MQAEVSSRWALVGWRLTCTVDPTTVNTTPTRTRTAEAFPIQQWPTNTTPPVHAPPPATAHWLNGWVRESHWLVGWVRERVNRKWQQGNHWVMELHLIVWLAFQHCMMLCISIQMSKIVWDYTFFFFSYEQHKPKNIKTIIHSINAIHLNKNISGIVNMILKYTNTFCLF